MIFLGYLLLNTILMVGFTWLAFAFYGYLPKVLPGKLKDSDLPYVSVVVPARNEESKIGRCLTSLAKQDYPRFEVIVIDDRSTDNTANVIAQTVAQYPIIKAVAGVDTPDGWIGKCNALAQASKYATGDYYVFTDADTCHNKNSIRDAVTYALTKKIDLLSFLPLQELGSFFEKLVMPVMLGSFVCGDPFNSVNDPNNERAYAYGQYCLIRADAYWQMGGHQSIASEILEDHALAKEIKKLGHRVAAVDGRSLYRVRMYTDLKSLWHGWTKNLYALIDCNLVNLFLVILLTNSCLLAPILCLAEVVEQLALGGHSPLLYTEGLLSLVQMVALALWFKRTSTHYIGAGLAQFLLLPLGSMVATLLYLDSAYLVLSGHKVNWKGRQYVVNRGKTIENGKGEVSPYHLPEAAEAPISSRQVSSRESQAVGKTSR
jgi:chlorobactene glucosyltransferase